MMYEKRWLPKSPTEENTVTPESRRLLLQQQMKHRREIEKLKRLEYNSRRREQRAREEIRESQAQIEEVTEVVEEQYEERLEEWKKEKKCLKKDLARQNARVRREPSKIQHAVQKAAKRSGDPDPVQQDLRYVKDRRGVVKEWARNSILTLVNEGVPMSKTWAITAANAKALGVTIVGKWSPRTSRRVVREGGIAAGLMIVEYILSCIGPQ